MKNIVHIYQVEYRISGVQVCKPLDVYIQKKNIEKYRLKYNQGVPLTVFFRYIEK